MGQSALGGDAGEFQLAAGSPSLALATPALLTFNGPTDAASQVTVVSQVPGPPAQVLAPQAFATVTVVSPFSYQITIYQFQAAGTPDPGTGLYPVLNGPANLICTWTIENPDASTNVFNRLRITQQPASGNPLVWMYTFNSSTSQWTLSTPGNLAEQRSTVTLDPTTGNRTELIQSAIPGGAVVAQETKVYSPFAWGEALTSDTLGSGSAAQTTQYSYYATSGAVGYTATANQPPLQQVLRPDGTWEYYSSYDSNGRPLTVLSGVDSAPTTQPSLCRSVVYSYAPVGSGDDGSIEPRAARVVTENIKGTPVALTYRVFAPGIRTELRCLTPTETYAQALADPNTQITTTTLHTDSTWDGWLNSIQYPDGTMTFYTYSGALPNLVTTVTTGQPDSATHSHIVDGTATITTIGDQNGGFSVGQLESVEVDDIKTGVALSLDVYSNYDPFYRPQQVQHLDGTTELTSYDCCGVSSTTDRDSVVSRVEKDAMNCALGTTVLSYAQALSQTNVLDPAGRVTVVVRNGGGSWAIVQRQIGYDTSSRITSETNALGGITTYSETTDFNTSQRTRTTTYPDLGTRIETYSPDGSLLKVTGMAVQPVRYVYAIETTAGSPDLNNRYVQEIKLHKDANYTDTSEWTKTYSDALGRAYKTAYSPRTGIDNNPPYRQSFFNNLGQLWKEIDPDGVITLYTYNPKGERELTIAALSASAISPSLTYASLLSQLGSIEAANSPDRITQVERTVFAASGSMPNLVEIDTYAYQDGSATAVPISSEQTSCDGLKHWSTVFTDASAPLTTSSVTSPGATRTVTRTAPDGTQTVMQYQYGRLISSATSNSGLGSQSQIAATSYGYDAHSRQASVTDARNGPTTFTFANSDQTATLTTPAPSPGQAPLTTSTYYDLCLRPWKTVYPDNGALTNQYDVTGLLTNSAGTRAYPVAYTYDYAGRVSTMTTWTNYPGRAGAAVTAWNYNPYRGWLDSKVYADGRGPSYLYTPGGRLQTRTWARPITTTYSYTVAGDLYTISYSDSTPVVTCTYDRRGRKATAVRNGITTTFTYGRENQPLGESYSGGALDGLSVNIGYDSYLRRSTLAGLLRPSTTLASATYGYDAASRLQTVTDTTTANPYSATYSYVANSPLAGQIVFANNGAQRMATTRQYDYLNRLTQVWSAPSIASPVVFNYLYNAAGQRVRATLGDGSSWVYGYDTLGQVISGHKFFADATPVAGQQFDYLFDNIGNRMQIRAGGDQTGANQRVSGYTVNPANNEYTQRTVPGAVDVIGLVLATNSSVTVNGTAPYRKAEYFRQQVTANNGSTADWQSISVVAQNETTVTGNIFAPKTPELFNYDYDGNLTSDGRWSYTWDAENRLVGLAANTSVGPANSLKFEYDWMGRRIHKQVWPNTNQSGYATNDVRFLYDGWNPLAQLNSSNNAVIETYLWGSDLSGSLQGAGGVGGLLEVVYHSAQTTNAFVTFDGNGNVAALVNAANGTNVASYEYGPFGEVLRMTGPMAKANPFRFSTKYQDDETDLVYYGYRYEKDGRWLSRDPITEKGQLLLRQVGLSRPPTPTSPAPGGIAPRRGGRPIGLWGGLSLEPSNRQQPSGNDLLAYQFCHNDPLNRVDIDGRVDIPPVVTQYYLWQGGLGVLSALLDWYQVKRQCESLAEEPDKEAFGQTVLSRLLTLANMPAIIVYCPHGGAIYRHIWFDDKCNCQKNFVVICNGGGGA